MKHPAPALLSLLRSDTQGELLAAVLLAPDQEFSLAELSRMTRAHGAVVHREISALVDAGVLLERREGRSRLVRANPDHELYRPLAEIIVKTYGPRELLHHALASLPEVEDAFIYGSWARRYAGEPGPAPQDIDVAVVGAVPRAALYDAAAHVEELIGKEVNITALSHEEWMKGSSGYLTALRESPRVGLVGA